MPKLDLPFRQIHMDFHTSELIEGVGKDFDADEFADTLARARVGQVCCFARCHHGMIYYDSKLNPERVHPHLVRRNLLAEQIEACHKRGIRVPIYTSVEWDHYTARRRPEWLARTPDGAPVGQNPDEPGFYARLCVNTPYRDFLKAHVREIFETMPAVDGLFFDIVLVTDCSCDPCRTGIVQAGLDPACEADRRSYAYDMISAFVLEMTDYVRGFNRDCSIYYNNPAIGPDMTKPLAGFTHLEFDALPGGHPGGYRGLPRRARFERNLGLDCIAQTGRFQTSWGDFHSYKNRAALEYECFAPLSLNCKCLVGDQLHPSGKIDKVAYDLIERVYSQIEKKEPWCRRAKAVVDIGVLSTTVNSVRGAMSILMESGHQFDIVDRSMDFSRFKVLILPDGATMDDPLARRIDEYVDRGGKVLASFESGMDAAKVGFILKCLPVSLASNEPIHFDGLPVRGRELGKNDYADFIVPRGKIGSGLPKVEHVMYMKGVHVKAVDGSEVLADVTEPAFPRTREHFCSHRHAPSLGKRSYPAIVRRAGVAYFGHPVFDLYNGFAPAWIKKMVLNALDMLLPDPVLRHSGPSTLETTVNVQEAERRWVIHLLHYVPLARARKLDVIEDVISLYDIEVSVKAPEGVKSVACVPEGTVLDFELRDGRIEFVVPCVNGHQMVELKR